MKNASTVAITEEEKMNDLGRIKKFKVTRTTKLGYMLTDGEKEYFLHRNESNYRDLQEGDGVEAFIYADKKGRLAATLYLPTATVERVGFGTVADVSAEYGAFLNIGISKDVLLSADDLPGDLSVWPKQGDRIACILKVRRGRLLAKPATKKDFLGLAKKTLELGSVQAAFVYRITASGINLVTPCFNVIFVHRGQLRKEYRLGEKVEVRITARNEDDHSGIIHFDRDKQIAADREKIIAYLKNKDGAAAINEKTSPLVIRKLFGLSKRAFKTALKSLKEEGIIEIQEDKIILLI